MPFYKEVATHVTTYDIKYNRKNKPTCNSSGGVIQEINWPLVLFGKTARRLVSCNFNPDIDDMYASNETYSHTAGSTSILQESFCGNVNADRHPSYDGKQDVSEPLGRTAGSPLAIAA